MPNTQASGLPRAGAVAAPLAVGALEGLGGHVLGRRAVAQQRGHVGVDLREGALVQRPRRSRGGCRRPGRARARRSPRSRTHYVPPRRSITDVLISCPDARMRRRLAAPGPAAPCRCSRRPAPAARAGRPVGHGERLRHARPPRTRWACARACPATAPAQRMYMRFRVAVLERARQSFVDTDSSSRWLRVGDGRAGGHAGGLDLQFRRSAERRSEFVLRGVVQFQWRERRRKGARASGAGEVVKQYERRTTRTASARRRGGATRRATSDAPLRSSRPGEQARVVRDHAVHAQRLERGDLLRVVHRPDVELAARLLHRAAPAAASRAASATSAPRMRPAASARAAWPGSRARMHARDAVGGRRQRSSCV